MIDHRNGKTSDNRWINLRTATHAQNAKNAA
ncbi:HNH endonuclease [Aureimonas altamirensis]